MSVSSSSSTYGNPLALSGLTGFDTSTIVQQLVNVESIPMQQIQQQETAVTNQQSAWSKYSSLLGSLQTAVDAFNDSTLYTATTASSSLSSNELSVTSDSTSTPGSYNVTVKQMALQEVVGSNYTSGTSPALPGYGQFQINGVTVTAGTSGSSTPLTIQQVATAINGTSGVGAAASVINNQLYITNTATGAAGINLVDGTGSILQDLGVVNSSNTPQNVVQAGQDATLVINGVSVSQASNTFTGQVQGLTMTITAPPTNTTNGDFGTVTVKSDTSKLQTDVNNFVTAYNNLNSYYKQVTAVNTSNSSQSGILVGDYSIQNIQENLVSLLQNPISGTGVNANMAALTDFGIGLDQQQGGTSGVAAPDGNLYVDQTKLTNALSTNASDFKNLFMTASTGLIAQVDSYVNTMNNSSTGIITEKGNTFTSMIKDYNNQIADWQTRLQSYQQSLTQQFTQMQIAMQTMNSQGTTLASMMGGVSSSSTLS